jgi:hypothetical protein
MAKVANFKEARRKRLNQVGDCGLSNEEFEDLRKIISDTITSLAASADKHNVDRNDFIRYAASLFKTMADVSSFYQFKEGER